MLDAIYVETKELKQVVAIQPKPAFGPIFQVVTAREGSGVVLINESPQTTFKPGEAGVLDGDGGYSVSQYPSFVALRNRRDGN